MKKFFLIAATILLSSQYGCTNGDSLTADYYIKKWKQNRDWALNDCQNLRTLNRRGVSRLDQSFVNLSKQNYKLTPSEYIKATGWLTGNYCPDVF
tara:strand:- start:466 stop:750 length:285 start_codon:yes stop_codon:yes gene_type:complete